MNMGVSVKLISFLLTTSLSVTLLHAQRAPDAGDKNKFSPIKPMVEVKRSSLYDNSHIIVHKGAHTIVPKKSILVLPPTLKGRISEKPKGKFVLWPEFKRNNQHWFWTFEVTLAQARGLKSIPEQKTKDLEKLNRIVIALYRGNPISVLPLKIETAEHSGQ
jgi:hypothetical protein